MDAKEQAAPTSGPRFLEKFERLVLWQRIAIVGGLCVLLIGAATWFLFLDQWEKIQTLDVKLQTLEKQLATAKINAAELERFQAKMEEAEAQFKIAMRALPETQEIPALLTSISTSGQEVGLDFLLFEPKAEVARDFYAEIPVSMTIRGDYHNMALFFDKVARLSRIVNITGVNMGPVKDSRDLNATCTAVTYKFVEPPPEKPAPAKPAPKRAAPKGGSGKK
jgi:type IV pilus assembly protein PilO